jgi:hypothetical protein
MEGFYLQFNSSKFLYAAIEQYSLTKIFSGNILQTPMKNLFKQRLLEEEHDILLFG